MHSLYAFRAQDALQCINVSHCTSLIYFNALRSLIQSLLDCIMYLTQYLKDLGTKLCKSGYPCKSVADIQSIKHYMYPCSPLQRVLDNVWENYTAYVRAIRAVNVISSQTTAKLAVPTSHVHIYICLLYISKYSRNLPVVAPSR